ncbi:MAG: oligoendopeptidase F [Candidatus Obscuribacterales bacterium]|nr:oligoendopeptidase F [Candidatus Obscuribacterales bacterium]
MKTSLKTKTIPTRLEVPVELTWDTTVIYPTEADWEADYKLVESLIPEMASYKGRLRRSGRLMLEAFQLRDRIYESFSKLSVYARMNSDVDTTDSHFQGLAGRVRDLGNKLSSARSYWNPEILLLKPERLATFFDKHEGLRLYRQEIEELLRERDHVRAPEVEELLAQAGQTYGGPASIFGMFNNADLKFPDVVDETGEPAPLSHGNWGSKWLDNPDRETRKRAYEAMFDTYNGYRNMLSASYAAQVKIDIFRSRARRYDSSLHQALDGINVPTSVYTSLIDTVHANLPTLQRYLDIRRRVLGLDKLAWYDLYVPLVGDLHYKITYEQAKKKVLASVAVLGREYVETLAHGYDSRWVDVMESKGKRSGAYSGGTYGTPPFMLLNWQDKMGSMFTLAHESGHSMHSFHSRKHQPYAYSGYTLFVAEVASTLNEALLAHHLLSETDDPSVRKYIINEQLERIRSTLFRQTMFAEFEKIAHEKAEAGEALTPDVLCGIHMDLNRKYFAPGVELDERIGIEWARIPHFYRSFYVYQYATGISAAMTLARQILNEGEPAVKRYLKFLSAGSSDYSINLLADAGVDLSSPTPIQGALDSFNDYLSQFEALL